MTTHYQAANWKKPLILAVTLVALGGVALWLETSYRPKKEAQDESDRKALPLKGKAIATIRVSDGKKSFKFRCLDQGKLCKPGDSSKWEWVEPLVLKADDSSVNSLVSSLTTLAPSDTIDLTVETEDKKKTLLAEYRLDETSRKSAKKVELTMEDGTVYSLILGDTHPIGDSQYALPKDEKKVLLIANHFKTNLEHPASHWRDKKLMTWNPHEIKAIHFEGPKGKWDATRKDTSWVLNQDIAGDIENIDTLLNAIAYMTAKDFISEKRTDARSKSILSNAKRVAKFDLKRDADLITLSLYQKGGSGKPAVNDFKLYATLSTTEVLYELEPSSKDRFLKDLKDIRLTKLITSMDRFGAKKLSFSGGALGGNPLVLENMAGKWLLAADKSEADLDQVNQFLDRISGNKITEFLGKTQPKGEESGIRVQIADEKGETKRDLVFWKSSDKVFARDMLVPKSEIVRVDPIIFESLPKSPDFFKKKVK
ncbi:MAG: DUF4340 domain-containing protein [Bdellovibrionales bacterium]|nr:DUF4340 domain-containing protein [Bdellovibrionales bacterium]